MPGAELQLAAYGRQDLELTGNPQITYFIAVYKRYTNFAIESIREYFIGEPIFGGKSRVILGKYGDLISKMYLDIILPSLNPENDPSFAISWVNSIGHAIIKKTHIEICGQKIDEQYGIWMEIWIELTLPSEKRLGYYNMIGKHQYFNVTIQQGELHLRIPLQFWFCKNIGLAIPNIALQNSTIELFMVFSEFEELFVSSTGNIDPLLGIAKKRNCPLSECFQIKSAHLYVDYIYLDDDERRWFVATPHNYLIEQIQSNVTSLDLTSINNVIELDFNHPVKALIWVIRDCIFFKKVPGGGNEWFNFSDRPTYLNLPLEDPMIEAILWFEGKYRFWPPREAKYFRELEPYYWNSNVPNNFIYMYSFSLFFDKHQPSGTCNFSMLDNVQLNVKLKDNLTDPQINIFAPNYNILIIENGYAGLKYLN